MRKTRDSYSVLFSPNIASKSPKVEMLQRCLEAVSLCSPGEDVNKTNFISVDLGLSHRYRSVTFHRFSYITSSAKLIYYSFYHF